MISAETLAGYVLEELLAFELKASGLSLIVERAQDPAVLLDGSNGLQILGRGAAHQVDVLGELSVQPRFTYPLRLFIEAKCRTDPIGLEAVRNAADVIKDVNEHFSWEAVRAANRLGQVYERRQYLYVLFSASGFSRDAQRYADAQQISLQDLRQKPFAWLPRRARRLADRMRQSAVALGISSFPVNRMRRAMRGALGTRPGDESPTSDRGDSFTAATQRARSASQGSGDRLDEDLWSELIGAIVEATEEATADGPRLYCLATDSPLLSVGQLDDGMRRPEDLLAHEFAARLLWGGPDASNGSWVVDVVAPEPLRLRLALPSLIEPLVLGRPSESLSDVGRARTLTLIGPHRETALHFEPIPIPEAPIALNADSAEEDFEPSALAEFRGEYVTTELTYRDPEAEDQDSDAAIWTPRAAKQLLVRLRSGNRPTQAEVIRQATLQGGRIPRDEVYPLGGYAADRMLTGFTKPTRRITRDLIDEGLLPEGVQWPLRAEYHNGRANYFVVPREFADFDL